MEKIIQITSGRGPAECEWVVAQVLKKMLEEAAIYGIKHNMLYREPGAENGTVATALIKLEGPETTRFVASWLGTILWIGKSAYRKFHKRNNWYVGIFEVQSNPQDHFQESDIRYQAIRSSGAGGQHVNKVSSAIRATHIPTGLSVLAMDSRSQHQNKKWATSRLLEKLSERADQKIKQQMQHTWLNQTQIERGNPIRTFEGSDFKHNKKIKSFKPERQKAKLELKKY